MGNIEYQHIIYGSSQRHTTSAILVGTSAHTFTWYHSVTNFLPGEGESISSTFLFGPRWIDLGAVDGPWNIADPISEAPTADV